MPYSYSGLDYEIRGFISEHLVYGMKVLDIGCGAGKYGKMFLDIDGVEPFKDYITGFNLESIYSNVYNQDALEFLRSIKNGVYCVAVLGDVLEHMTVEYATEVLKLIKEKIGNVVVVVPYEFEQDECYSNPLEKHIQADLTNDVMSKRYHDLTLLVKDDVVGVYGFKKG